MQLAPSLISPAENFDVFYYLRNPTDSTTYYVRAVIYDVRTGGVLSTINLTRSIANPHLFSAVAQAPADSSGFGRNIVAVASVYLDSLYASKSQDYEEQEQYFLVKAQVLFTGGGGGVDYRTVREIFAEELEAHREKLPPPTELPDMPFDALFGAVGALQREVNRVPKDQVDVGPLKRGVTAILAAIGASPTPEPVDLSPVLSAIAMLPQQLAAALSQATAGWQATSQQLVRDQDQAIKGMSGKIVKAAEAGLKDLMDRQELTIPMSSIVHTKEPVPSSIAHIM
jgi:hypothetical protein